MAEQYGAGADPAVVIEDMLDLTHWLTRVKVVPEVAQVVSGSGECRVVVMSNAAGFLSASA